MSEAKRQQVIALGRLGWPLRRVEAEIGVRRETASAYLRSAGVPIRAERRRQLPAKVASGDPVSTDSAAAKLGARCHRPTPEPRTAGERV